MDLPEDLRSALDELEVGSAKQLTRVAADLSQRYRRGLLAGGGGLRLWTDAEAVAYAACRMPATYAAIYVTLRAVRERRPDWQPKTLLDAGAGLGTAMWAAREVWPDIERVTLLEWDARMLALGRRLAAETQEAVVREATWQQTDLADHWDCPPHDLVVAAYVLGEVPLDRRDDVIARLWASCGDTLLLVEPGTPDGFALIRQARDKLRDAGAFTLAPCPHDRACPMTPDDWCHFSQRLPRSRLHRRAKQATLSYEDEKFSYAAMSRRPGLPIAARVIRHPQIRPGHIHLELCKPEGLARTAVTRRDRERFRRARDAKWGSAFDEGSP